MLSLRSATGSQQSLSIVTKKRIFEKPLFHLFRKKGLFLLHIRIENAFNVLTEIFSRIDDGPILVNLKVTMRARAISRATHGGDILSLLYRIAGRNCQ